MYISCLLMNIVLYFGWNWYFVCTLNQLEKHTQIQSSFFWVYTILSTQPTIKPQPGKFLTCNTYNTCNMTAHFFQIRNSTWPNFFQKNSFLIDYVPNRSENHLSRILPKCAHSRLVLNGCNWSWHFNLLTAMPVFLCKGKALTSSNTGSGCRWRGPYGN